MKIKHVSMLVAAATATVLPLPPDVTRARRWQLYVRSSTAAVTLNDSAEKSSTHGMYIPLYTTGSGDFQAGTYRYGDKLWLFSVAGTTFEGYFKEII